jgi:DNA-directed RNA polymerase subunit RPC12/RpoP
MLVTGSYVSDEVFYIMGGSGGYADPYRYPVNQKEIDDLWKCIACGRVHKLKEHLDCPSCGTSVTEKSRFVLE